MSSEYNTGICISSLIRHKPKTTVLTVALVLVGMMFLVPAITDKAMGETHAQVPDYGKYQNYDDPKACCSFAFGCWAIWFERRILLSLLHPFRVLQLYPYGPQNQRVFLVGLKRDMLKHLSKVDPALE